MHGGASREVIALRSLHDTITTVHAVQDLAEVLQRTAQGVVDVLGFQVAVVDWVDSDGSVAEVEALAVAGDPEACAALKGRRMPLTEILDEFEIAETWGSLRFVPHDRLPADAISTWVPDVEPLDAPDAWHPLDALYAPLHGPTGDLLGVLSVDLPVDRRRPGPLARQILEMYAVQAGLAIHHAQERQRYEERLRLGSAVRTIVETASQELDIAHVLDTSFAPLIEGFRSSGVMLRLLDDGELTAAGYDGAGHTHPAGLMDALKEKLRAGFQAVPGGASTSEPGQRLLDLGERVARDCWDTGRTCVVAAEGDTTADLLTKEERIGAGLLMDILAARSLIVVPLGAGAECLGYLILVRSGDEARWTTAEDEAAREVGREIGRAVERARLYQRERRLVGELQELDRHKGEMIATITHELKNPLTSLYGHVQLLAEQGVAPARVEALSRNVTRLQRLVDDLLLLTKMKDPHRPFIPAPVDLAALVHEACDLLGVQAQARGLTLDARAVTKGVLVPGDREELARMVVNIIGNALRYTPAGGEVTLRVSPEWYGAVFACSDTGIGIAEEDVPTLFDEFSRSSNPDAHKEPGSGLGLAIVRRIVERHSGTVEVESVLGVGSTFRVSLPGLGAYDTMGSDSAGARPVSAF